MGQAWAWEGFEFGLSVFSLSKQHGLVRLVRCGFLPRRWSNETKTFFTCQSLVVKTPSKSLKSLVDFLELVQALAMISPRVSSNPACLVLSSRRTINNAIFGLGDL